MEESIVNKINKQLFDVLDKEKINDKQLVEILSLFLYSIGASLENVTPSDSKEILKRYAKQPTLGNAMMAQALWMKEAWTREEEK